MVKPNLVTGISGLGAAPETRSSRSAGPNRTAIGPIRFTRAMIAQLSGSNDTAVQEKCLADLKNTGVAKVQVPYRSGLILDDLLTEPLRSGAKPFLLTLNDEAPVRIKYFAGSDGFHACDEEGKRIPGLVLSIRSDARIDNEKLVIDAR